MAYTFEMLIEETLQKIDEVKEDEEYYAYIEKMGIVQKGP